MSDSQNLQSADLVRMTGTNSPDSLRVLFVGPIAGTSGHRLAAFRRLGHLVTAVNPYEAFRGNSVLHAWAFKTGALGFSGLVERLVGAAIASKRFDLAWVESGDIISAACVETMRRSCGAVVLYHIDNCFAPRDGRRWRLLFAALTHYDLFVAPRDRCVDEALRSGARRALRVNMSADEVVHRRPELSDEDLRIYASEVAFVGTWMPERGPFLLELVRRGVPLKIFGPRWRRAQEFEALGDRVVDERLADAEYVKAISATKVGLVLLSKGNLDLHTTRSFEIPAVGTLLCAERSIDHERLYRENEEAVFWSNAAECADLCFALLADERRRSRVAEAGRRRVAANRSFNEASIFYVLSYLGF
ncbi:glycosyltransferase [Methylosinus sporium]|uniref:Glycosyltransferase n=1 Tax=Methylosinus sporium TaxID=428 RepID=A0A549SDI2_METSR|nr:glycosyltransferase [Methylosinus sporium]TRL26520.1 glycosyltransferase [Methylosinus sporium]